MAEERKERKDMTHAEKIADHFRILGRPNPFAAAHSGTPAQRKGGLGSNKGAARYQNTSAEDRAKANSDGRYGYFDEVNKRYVPAIFDMMDGGGFDTRGDEFKGGIFSGMLNDLGVKPYGSQMERAMVSPNTSPIVQAVSGTIPRPRVRPEQSMQFGDQPAGSMPSMSFGQQPAGSMPAATPSPTNIPSDPATEGYRLGNMESYMLGNNVQSGAYNAAMQQARIRAIDLAARAGLNFDTMPQEQKAQYINAVMSLN